MAFSPCKFYKSDASFTPLFRLLNDFDNYSRQDARRSAIPQWQPKFDIRETQQAYELHGEFPGVNMDNVNVIFTDPQTILISGKKERALAAGATPTVIAEDTSSDTVSDIDEKRSSYQATVEDEEFESISYDGEEAPEQAEKTAAEVVEPKKAEKTETTEPKPTENAKWWLTERTVGQFSRSFNFHNRVEHDAATANFKDGILSIIVPKAEKHESRPISIN
ncbi:heat shock protein 30 [Ilyonectria sp. MPI-CAGE-AT-0026]|nr:heat shock protein 30 [Ilyonectria sp. MPI-CAGE-AT-0026]